MEIEETKKCSGCSEERDLVDFPFKNKAKGIRRARCKFCQREYSRSHYRDNKAMYLEKNKRNAPAWMAKRKLWLEEQKRIKGGNCLKCLNADLSLLEFHHTDPETKKAAVIDLLKDCKSLETVEEEIAKCILLCGNCHTIVTHTENKTWRTKPVPTEKDIDEVRALMKEVPLSSKEQATIQVLSSFENCSSCHSDAYKDQCSSCRSKFHKYVHQARIKKRIPYRNKIGSMRSKMIIGNLLQESSCLDCQEDNWMVLEFDHVKGEKSKNLSQLSSEYVSLKTIQDEIDKCEIVCRNCHSKRTARRRKV